MTEQEKIEILNELEARFEKKYKGCLTKEDTQSILKEPRNKWFRDIQGNGCNSLMTDAFDSSIVAWQVWEIIRKLTCVVCGKQYVRHLERMTMLKKLRKSFVSLYMIYGCDRKRGNRWEGGKYGKSKLEW